MRQAAAWIRRSGVWLGTAFGLQVLAAVSGWAMVRTGVDPFRMWIPSFFQDSGAKKMAAAAERVLRDRVAWLLETELHGPAAFALSQFPVPVRKSATAVPTDMPAASIFPSPASPTPRPSTERPISAGSSGVGTLGPTATTLQGTVLLKRVLIYHSHPYESWISETQKTDDHKTNITLVGRRLAESLERLGVGVVHTAVDYRKEVPNYNWYYSYKYSLQTIRDVMAVYPDVAFFFDIHRDSFGRDRTTLERNGTTYAKIMFVVGRQNPNWEQNEAFARRLDALLNAEMPGISRGMKDKDAAEGHGEYNQSVSPNSILVEIGGPENTLEECYRSADVLASAIAAVVRERVAAGKED
ncbi:MAG: hypothetical protein BLM47_08995 [Candidatus Reconcilbacillus cellulovorans]|uniref:Stage II sporulation protein P n=1 Tax=Candidatus Reconcilbacillus cellulovorans TaxID=1906605 RepID=A0A2A6DZS3_9BACL|nr:MAG: hypothetical protein BLM47_08995 [Candidatus Reconcilbacillus cellulovorans]